MKKFKRWLIHKLGGMCKDEVVKPNIILTEKEREIRKIRAEFRTTFKKLSKEEVKRILLDGIWRELSEYYFEIKKYEENMCDIYSMELEVVLQQRR